MSNRRGPYGTPMPADFPAIAGTMARRALARHYGVCWRAVARWQSELGIPIYKLRSDATPVPDDFADLAPTMTKAELMDHYDKRHDIITRWTRVVGVTCKPFVRPPAQPRKTPLRSMSGVGRRFVQSQPLAGVEEEAAHFLRRQYPAVYHCDHDGHANPKGDRWLCGARIYTPAQLVDKAKDKGWDPDAWKRIAA